MEGLEKIGDSNPYYYTHGIATQADGLCSCVVLILCRGKSRCDMTT